MALQRLATSSWAALTRYAARRYFFCTKRSRLKSSSFIRLRYLFNGSDRLKPPPYSEAVKVLDQIFTRHTMNLIRKRDDARRNDEKRGQGIGASRLRRCRLRHSLSGFDGGHIRVNWQIKYALASLVKEGRYTPEHVSGDVIRIMTQDRPDVLAAVTAIETVSQATAAQYREQVEGLDFLCGYPARCFWEGEAIQYLEQNRVGWGNFGTLGSAALNGNANSAARKVYKFSDRLLRQYGRVVKVFSAKSDSRGDNEKRSPFSWCIHVPIKYSKRRPPCCSYSGGRDHDKQACTKRHTSRAYQERGIRILDPLRR